MAIPILDEKLDDTPILGCFEDVKLLLCSWCCGACTLARIRAGLRGSKEGCSAVELITSCILGPCCMFKTRGDFRDKYSKALESPVLDQILSCWCCSICAMSQMGRHMQRNNDFPPMKISAN